MAEEGNYRKKKDLWGRQLRGLGAEQRKRNYPWKKGDLYFHVM